ncbi:hypothetical protein ACQWFV_25615, partial [Salmonella enterica subsp. enterica serovar Infantis]
AHSRRVEFCEFLWGLVFLKVVDDLVLSDVFFAVCYWGFIFVFTHVGLGIYFLVRLAIGFIANGFAFGCFFVFGLNVRILP